MIPSCPLIMTSQFHCPSMCCSLSNAWIIVLAREVSSTRTLFWVTTGKSWMNRLLPGASDHQWVWGKGSSFAAGQWVTVLKVHSAISCLGPLSALTDWTWICWEEGVRLNWAAQEIHGVTLWNIKGRGIGIGVGKEREREDKLSRKSRQSSVDSMESSGTKTAGRGSHVVQMTNPLHTCHARLLAWAARKSMAHLEVL